VGRTMHKIVENFVCYDKDGCELIKIPEMGKQVVPQM